MNNNEQNNLNGVTPMGVMPDGSNANDLSGMTTATIAPEPTAAPMPAPDAVGMPEAAAPAFETPVVPDVMSASNMAPEAPVSPDAASVPMPDASIAPESQMPDAYTASNEAAPANSDAAPMPEATLAPDPNGLTLDPSIVAPSAIEPYKEPEPEPKKKNNKKPLIIVLVIALIALLAVGGFAAYIFLFVKPDKIHKEVIAQIFNNVNTMLTANMKDAPEEYDTLTRTGKVTFSTNVDELSIIDNYAFNYKIGVDPGKNLLSMETDLLEKGKNLLEGNFYIKDNIIYFEGNKIYDGVINVGNTTFNVGDLFDSKNTLTKEEASYVINAFKNALTKSFDQSKYERKLTNANINGKSQKVFNNYYLINEATSYQMAKSMASSIKADTKAVEIIAKIYGSDISDINEMLDEMISSLTDPEVTGDNTVISFNVYTSIVTNEVLAVRLMNGATTIVDYTNNKGVINCNITIETLEIVLNKNGNKTTVKAVFDHNPILELVITKENENKTTFNLKLTLESLLTGSSVEIKTIEVNMVTEIKDDTTNITLTVIANVGEETYDLIINDSSTLTKNEKVTTINTDNAVDYAEITSEELQANLLKALDGSDLYTLLGGEENPNNPDDPDVPVVPENPDEPNTPSKPEVEYSSDEECATAREKEASGNGKCACSGDVCTCTYSTGSFGNRQEHTATCKNS